MRNYIFFGTITLVLLMMLANFVGILTIPTKIFATIVMLGIIVSILTQPKRTE